MRGCQRDTGVVGLHPPSPRLEQHGIVAWGEALMSLCFRQHGPRMNPVRGDSVAIQSPRQLLGDHDPCELALIVRLETVVRASFELQVIETQRTALMIHARQVHDPGWR